IANSEISNINSNAGKSVIVSEDSFELIQKGIFFGTISDDLFDISIGPLVDLWGISGDNQHIPSQADIDSTMLKVDYRNISMDNQNKSISIAEGMSLDTGAIAKGFVTDKLVGILREKNVKSALLNLGGNLYLYGSKPDSSLWTVGIRDPFGSQGDHLGTVAVKDMSVVTSGIYERYFEKDGERLHHILNPETGYPSDNGLAAVSILSPNSTNCDGLSTACFLLGVDKGMELIEQFENVEAIMVTTDKKVYVSGGIKNGEIPFKLTNDDYTILNK
ncbi:MAG TPA: FAD:protein FMN transferase, partial [Thermoclostridium sp.]|nr:FAD:protein FMN transferase [Thermoclostridium sp.]